jgi:hypothetical protein
MKFVNIEYVEKIGTEVTRKRATIQVDGEYNDYNLYRAIQARTDLNVKTYKVLAIHDPIFEVANQGRGPSK